MPLESSGSLSFGGSVQDRSINLELRRSATSTLGLNDGEARYLANVPTGNISVSDFYGKSYYSFGQAAFTTPGTFEWVCPNDVFTVSVVCVGGGGGGDAGDDLIGVGGGGGGGALAYRNNIEVVAGQTYTIIVGSGGLAQITVNGTTTQESISGTASSAFSCVAGGGANGTRSTGGGIGIGIGTASASGGTVSGVYNGGYAGGTGGTVDTSSVGFRVPGGGGAAGYSGIGGEGARGARAPGTSPTASGLGGSSGLGGGGGGGGSGFSNETIRTNTAGNGGGVGILGQGPSGAGGSGGSLTIAATDGGNGSSGSFGAGGSGGIGGDNRQGRNGVPGAVRIIWPGNLRSFPTTITQNA